MEKHEEVPEIEARQVQLSPDDMAMLRSLHSSPAWRLLRRIYLAQRDAILLNQMINKFSSDELFKRCGKAEGLNLAATTLDGLIAQFNTQARRVAEESKNQPVRDGKSGMEDLSV